MPEFNRPTAELAKVVAKIPDARNRDLDWHIKSEAQKQVNRVQTTKTIDLTEVNPNYPNWKKEVSLDTDTVDSKMRSVLNEGGVSAENTANRALQIWDNLEVAAVEKFGASREGGNAQAEGKVGADKTIKEHDMVAGRHETLASSVIEHMNLDASDELSDHNLLDVLDIDWDGYAADAGVSRESITVGQLKRDPAFQEFRNDIVKKVQDLANETSIDLKQDWKSPKKLLSKVWSNFTLSRKVGFVGQERADFNLDLNNARKLSEAQANLANLPSLESAQEYRQNYAKFLQEANIALDLKDVADAMPAFSRIVLEKHGQKLDAESAAKSELRNKRKEFVKTGRDAEAQAAILQAEAEADKARREAEVRGREAARLLAESEQKAIERAARMELRSLSMEARLFADAADKHAEVASKGLAILAEYQYKEGKTAEFDAMIAEGTIAPDFKEVVDFSKEVDLFIESKGQKGDYTKVRGLFDSINKVVSKAEATEGLPSSFITLNTLQEGENKKLETGLLAGIAEDGSWEIKLATREGKNITEANPELPVIRLKPEGILASLKVIEIQNEALSTAKLELLAEQNANAFGGGTAENRKKHRIALNTAKASVAEYQRAVDQAKEQLAIKLRASDTQKTLGGALKEMSDAQSAVAEEFYGRDYAEFLKDFADEVKLKPSQITPEVLASITSSAQYSSERAGEMAKYLQEVTSPETIEAKLIGESEPWIMNMSFDYVRLQEDEARSREFNDPKLTKAAKEIIDIKKISLQKQAKELALRLNEGLIDETTKITPEAFRKGSEKIGMTRTELRKAVAETLRFSGFDPEKYQKSSESKPVTIAQRVHDSLPYNDALKVITDKAIDAMRDLGKTNATRNLVSSLEGGDVTMFMSKLNEAQAKLTESTLVSRQVDAEMNKIEEMASSSEGLAKLMRGAEVRWSKVLDAVDDGKLGREVAYPAILASEVESDKLEAARRVQGVLMQTIAPMINVKAGEPDELAGRADVVADINFLNEATNGATTGFLQVYLERATTEKKTIVNQE